MQCLCALCHHIFDADATKTLYSFTKRPRETNHRSHDMKAWSDSGCILLIQDRREKVKSKRHTRARPLQLTPMPSGGRMVTVSFLPRRFEADQLLHVPALWFPLVRLEGFKGREVYGIEEQAEPSLKAPLSDLSSHTLCLLPSHLGVVVTLLSQLYGRHASHTASTVLLP